MVQAIQGSFVTCSDDSVKQILTYLDSKMHFIIEDIDEKHLLIESTQVDQIKKLVDEVLAENTFIKSEGGGGS
jgi:hypothetical protein